MTIDERLKESEQKFEDQRKQLEEQENIIKVAENSSVEIRTEMAKLQGEYRVLKDLKESEKVIPKANVIEAKPEEIKS